MNFTEIKQVIIDRAKKSDACADQFSRAAKAETMPELLKVITDNFQFCCLNKIIDIELLSKIEVPLLDEAKLYFNRDVTEGYCLVVDARVRTWGNATVWAFGTATVRASGNATVLASDNATVLASDNATVLASDNATVEAFDNAKVEAFGNATVRASGNATVWAFGTATVRAFGKATVEAFDNATVRAFGNATVEAFDNATVEAFDNAFTLSYNSVEHKSGGNSIIRWIETNRVVFGGKILNP